MKIKVILTAASLAAVAVFTGCETLPPGVERGPDGTVAYEVLIEASEPGARIEANHEFVGNTPLRLKIYGDRDGTFHDFGAFEYVIQAFPLATNQFPQTRIFRTGRMFTPEDRIPQKIFFEMDRREPVYPGSYGGSGYPPPAYYGPGVYYGPPVYFGGRIYIGPHGGWHRRW